jgi:hypothetical protein
MQADSLPQNCIEALADLLLDLPEPEHCIRCGSPDVTHYHQQQPYCELCRGCWDTSPEK